MSYCIRHNRCTVSYCPRCQDEATGAVTVHRGPCGGYVHCSRCADCGERVDARGLSAGYEECDECGWVYEAAEVENGLCAECREEEEAAK